MTDLTAPDGSPVELYAVLPPDGEAEIVHGALPAGATILELGCGAGRVTHGLVALGHSVVAVDQSAAMLAFVRGVETVLADIETLDLGRRFDCVLLGSHLVDTPDAGRLQAFLRTCRRHVQDGGVVLIERHDPAWTATAGESSAVHNGIRYAMRDVVHEGDLLSGVMEYELGSRTWTHAFTARVRGDAALARELEAAGLRLARVLPPGRRWVVAAGLEAEVTGDAAAPLTC